MANIKFYKRATRPTSITEGSIWFDSSRQAIILAGTDSTKDVVYSGCITKAEVSGESLVLTKTDGTVITVDFSKFALDTDIAKKIDKENVGSATQPVYNTTEGLKACSHTLNADVPADAVFTDTHYTNSLTIKASGTEAVKFSQNADTELNIIGSGATAVSKSANGQITIFSTDTNTDTKVTSVENHYKPSGGSSVSGSFVTGITKDATGHVTGVATRGALSSDDIPNLNASKITSGTIDIARLPKGALERLFVVADEAAAMKADVQEGDTVKVTGNSNKMYFCVGDVTATGATFATCFTEYTAGTATSVPWSGVTDKPSTYTPSAHTHTKDQVGLWNVDNTADDEKYVKGVIDFANENRKIEIGYGGDDLTKDDLGYIAGYRNDADYNHAYIKAFSKDTLKAWLGLGSMAYKSGNYAGSSFDGGDANNAIKFNGHTYSDVLNTGISKRISTDTNTTPYYRFAHSNVIHSWMDKSVTLLITKDYNDTKFGILKIVVRSNNLTESSIGQIECRAWWLVRSGFEKEQIFVKWNEVNSTDLSNVYVDFYYKANNTYDVIHITKLAGGSRDLINQNIIDFDTSDSALMAEPNLRDYTNTYLSEDVGIVNQANKLLNYKSLSLVTDIGFNGNATTGVIPDVNTLAYWNGAYESGGASNISYTAVGRLGKSATHDDDYYAVKDHTHNQIIAFPENHKETASGTEGNSPSAGMVSTTQGLFMSKSYFDSAAPYEYGNIINVLGIGSGQIFCSWAGSDSATPNIFYRAHRDTNTGGWGPWKMIAYTSDIPSYSAGAGLELSNNTFNCVWDEYDS